MSNYTQIKRDLLFVLLISMVILTISGFAEANNHYFVEGTTDNSTENLVDSVSTKDPLVMDSSFKSKLSQTTPTFNLNDYEDLVGTQLHFSGWIDYNNDTTNDMIFVVEFPNPLSPYNLVILDGVTYDILETYEDIAENSLIYSDETYFITNPSEDISDLMLLFKGDTTNLCNWVFVGVTSGDLGTFTEDCNDYQHVVDWDGDGNLEVIRVKSQGDYWTYAINETMGNENTGNLIAFTGIDGEFNNFRIGNFNGDNISDYALTQLSPDQTTTQLYLIDGFTSSVISNTSIGQNINTILIIDIDNTGFDEIIYLSESNKQLSALNVSGFELTYSENKHGYQYESAKTLTDLNEDGIEDILLIKEKSQFLIVSGADGTLLVSPAFYGAIENTYRSNNEISIGQLSNSSHFILQSDDLGISISTYTEDDRIILQDLISWSLSIEISSTEYLLKQDAIDFNIDLDQDGLTTIDEFFFSTDDLSDDSDSDLLPDIFEIQLKLNPISRDTDQDGMNDYFEEQNGLNYLLDDAEIDIDGDGLTNIQEYEEGTDINRFDTDGDSLPDGWEIQYNYHANGTTNNRYANDDNDTLLAEDEYEHGTNPLKTDTDDDGIPDGWEVNNGLNPTSHQIFTDFDNDGLSALQEYQNNIDPNNADTDGDGLEDGYEVHYGLDPNDPNDAGEDKDGDFLSNRFEERLGTNPNGKFDRIISYFIVTFSAISIGYFSLTYRRLSREAKSTGFLNYMQMRSIRKLGFLTLNDYEIAQSLGFNFHEAQVLVNSYGHQDVNSILLKWQSYLKQADEYLNNKEINNLLISINEVVTYTEYDETVQNSKYLVESLQLQIQRINKLILELDTIIDLIERSKTYPFRNLEKNQIENHKQNLHKRYNSLIKLNDNYSKLIDSKENWFKPWLALLTLIQLSADKSISDLEEMAQVLNIGSSHAKSLILAVIIDNQLIGSFSEETNQFIKGTNIDGYLKYVLDNMELDEEE